MVPSTTGFKSSPVNRVENLNSVVQDNKNSTVVASTDTFKRQSVAAYCQEKKYDKYA